MGSRFDLETFLTVYHDVIDEINAEREREGIEITCQERFERTFARLGYTDPGERSFIAFHLTRVHMDGVRKVTFAPPERRTPCAGSRLISVSACFPILTTPNADAKFCSTPASPICSRRVPCTAIP